MSAFSGSSKPAPAILLEKDVIEMKLQSRPLWELAGFKGDGSRLKRVFDALNVKAAHEFMSKVYELSEEMRHHPEVFISTRGHVEITTFTHTVGGITERDFDLVDEIDRLPVRYSEIWREENRDRLYEFKREQQARDGYHSHHPCTNKHCMCPHCTCGESCSCGISKEVVCDPCVDFKAPKDVPTKVHMHSAPSRTHHHIHHEDEIVPTPPTSAYAGGASVHSAHDAHSMHAHSFRVDTARHTTKGHGDGVDNLKEAHAHDGENTMSQKGDAGFPTEHAENEAWLQMAQGLSTLKSRGYDIAVADSLLPMVENRRIYRDWITDMRNAYVHIHHRLDPAWAKTEPQAVVDACRKFVHGYEVISHIYLGLGMTAATSTATASSSTSVPK